LDMKNEKQKRPSILEVAKKKRHYFLLQKLSEGKHFSRSELKELEKFEGGKLPVGVIDTQEKLAKILDVSVRTVQYWEKDGLPRTKQGFYDLKVIHEWRLFNKRGKKPKEINGAKKDYENEYRKYKSLLAEMEYKEKKGQLVHVKDVERDSVQKIIAIKQKFLSLPRVIAPQLDGLHVVKIEEILRMRIEEIINDFAQGTPRVKTKKKK